MQKKSEKFDVSFHAFQPSLQGRYSGEKIIAYLEAHGVAVENIEDAVAYIRNNRGQAWRVG